MKKTTITALAIAGFIFASCKKDRTCECTVTRTNGSSGGTVYFGSPDVSSTTTTVYKKVKKSDMKALCADTKNYYESISRNPNGSTTVVTQLFESKCKLK
jgi:hypothetical protein